MIQAFIAYLMSFFLCSFGLAGLYKIGAKKIQESDTVYYLSGSFILLVFALLAAKQGGI